MISPRPTFGIVKTRTDRTFELPLPEPYLPTPTKPFSLLIGNQLVSSWTFYARTYQSHPWPEPVSCGLLMMK